MSNPSVILLEFNELTPAVIERFMAEGHLPNFSRFAGEAVRFTTRAEEPFTLLEPWIQWVTVHSGLAYKEHGVLKLDQGHHLAAPRLWDLVSREGRRSWVCGSMNVNYEADCDAYVLPDPWCTKVAPRPDELRPFFDFVQTTVQEHTNEAHAASPAAYARFAAWMLQRGLSMDSVTSIMKQLSTERFDRTQWKRPAVLDQLQFDVFSHYYRRLRPAFSTLFLNSTAHFQHAYWDSMEPAAYSDGAGSGERTRFKDAIRFGYEQMDALLGRILQLAGSDVTLVLCTALSQEPSRGERDFYRPRDIDALIRLAGLPAHVSVAPVMTQQFFVEFADTASVEDAVTRLAAVRWNDQPALRTRRDGLRLFVSCGIRSRVPAGATLAFGDSRLPFEDVFYRVPTRKVADHNPDGLFWIRQPDRATATVAETVPLTSVAPTLLKLLGIGIPDYMGEPVPTSAMAAQTTTA
ncbi:MAG: hypothetical protein HOP14_10525 [Acidobacteria bacterium]|nr:hypothetical protein [Acidobacteriota bacterium]